ncbi:phage major capsid protein [Saccharopolyspora mangrovi]|uniref:Phage major capsid protein n=1 Tax=Saccharopolyspora mangrovi TaxID=3082379 RepID=A0ABU6A7F0_9PSEU|nr:phage major capsid protein [Saccharopolyspora sp. S2-29]MEB3367411.1 phage major capsid protein [Saccharopolyspora sp. S2-29]
MSDFPALRDVEGRLEAKNKDLALLFEEAGPEYDMKKVSSFSDPLKTARSLKEEIDALGQERDDLLAVKKAADYSRSLSSREGEQEEKQRSEKAEYKSLGESFMDSIAVKGKMGPVGPTAHLDVDFKSLFDTVTGWTPETTRTGKVVDFATRPVQVTDIFPTGSTQQQAVVYMEETTFTNAAAETAEAGTFPEAALGLIEKSSPVRKTAVWLPITDEQLEDEEHARGYVNRRLPFMLKQRLDGQLLNGNGTAPNLRGVLNVVGIQTHAKGADPIPDAVRKAMTKVRVTGRAMPDNIVMHSNDWQEVRLLRTADGIYIWGSPSETGEARMWGLPVVENDVIVEGTALVGDFGNYSELTSRRGIDVQITNSHADFFINGKQAVRADVRCALVVYRPTAFCTVTGI